MRRWNLTIIIVVCAFVLGTAAGYVYRDRFSAMPAEQPVITSGELEAQLFESHVAKLLKPTSSIDAISQPSYIYSLTGRITNKTADQLEVEVPNDEFPDDDTLTFLLTPTTEYVSLQIIEQVDGNRELQESPLTLANLSIGDTVSVYSAEDLLSTTDWHLTKVQKLNNQ